MKGFAERARVFEMQYARKQEFEFIVNMKACRNLARWVAEEKLNLPKQSVTRYCNKVAALAVRDCKPETLFSYIHKKLQKHNLDIDDRELHYRYALALREAQSQ